MVNRKKIYKGVLGLLAVLVVLSVINATQFARVGAAYSYTVSNYGAYVHFLTRDGDPIDSSKPVLTSSGNTSYSLSLGIWCPGTNKTYTAAFAIVNEEDYAVTLVGVNVEGTGIDYVYIYAHKNANKTCTADKIVTDVAANRETVAGESALLWNGSAGKGSGTWVLAKGDGNTATYDHDGDAAAPYYNATWNADNINAWHYDKILDWGYTDSNQPATNGTSDYVWIEICLQIPSTVTSSETAYTGTISFMFESAIEV